MHTSSAPGSLGDFHPINVTIGLLDKRDHLVQLFMISLYSKVLRFSTSDFVFQMLGSFHRFTLSRGHACYQSKSVVHSHWTSAFCLRLFPLMFAATWCEQHHRNQWSPISLQTQSGECVNYPETYEFLGTNHTIEAIYCVITSSKWMWKLNPYCVKHNSIQGFYFYEKSLGITTLLSGLFFLTKNCVTIYNSKEFR